MTKDVRHMSSVEHLVSHGVVGAFSGLALGLNPVIQVTAQIMGEVSASMVKDAEGPDSKEKGIAVARVVGAMAGLTMGGDVKDINGAIEAGGRAAEFNTFSGQERIKEWNAEQEKEKEKLARRLVTQGIVSQEAMDQAYDSLTLVDLEEIKADYGRAVSKDVKSSVEVSYDRYKDGRHAQLDLLRGDFQLEKIVKAASTLATDLSLEGKFYFASHMLELYSAYKSPSEAQEKPVVAPAQVKIVPIRGEYDVDPSEPFQNKEYVRNILNLMSLSQDLSKARFDYIRAYKGSVQSPEDFRNLVPGAEYFKIAGDVKNRFSAKWSGRNRNYAQKIVLTVTGDPHLAVTAGFGGAAALDFVADPSWLAGGAGKVVQTGKAAVKGVSGARAISHAAKGAAGFADAVAAAKSGSRLAERGAAVAGKAEVAAKGGAVATAEASFGKSVAQGAAKPPVAAVSEKALAKDMSPRVKPRQQTTAPAADKNYFDGSPKIKQLDRKGFVEIDGIQIRGVRDLSHMSDADVWKMFKKGANPVDVNGDTIIYHHVGQQYHRAPDSFMAHIPSESHGIWNSVQHPYGNTKGAGLSKAQRNEWKNKDNPMINKTLGEHELKKRGLLDE